tara:strand:+ start:242 stop:637 length:396 start_codon:yes stop_codon:yes gene_type:complete
MKMIDWHKKRIEWFKNKTGCSHYGIYWISFVKGIMIGVIIMLLTGCGTAPAWLATSGGAYSEYKVTSLIKTGADLALSAADLPTTTDFALSKITGYDCKITRAIKQGVEYVCKSVKVHPPTSTTIDNDEKK